VQAATHPEPSEPSEAPGPVVSSPGIAFPSRRPSRIGPILFVSGLVLVSANFFLSAWAYYDVFNSTSISSFQSIALAFGIGEILTAIGALLAATGWVVGKRESARFHAESTAQELSPLLGVGQAIVLVGAIMIAAASVYLGALELAEYLNVTVTEPWWTFPLFYSIEGAGIVALACGWWAHHSASSGT